MSKQKERRHGRELEKGAGVTCERAKGGTEKEPEKSGNEGWKRGTRKKRQNRKSVYTSQLQAGDELAQRGDSIAPIPKICVLNCINALSSGDLDPSRKLSNADRAQS